ncbi:MAG TPA: protein kinase [Burkholderiales bacterium]|nr:protein kinase [Burkholderiales bacterium]
MTHPVKIGKYEIQGVLGKGGMGVVYKGWDPAISRSVAIKAIAKASLDPGELKQVRNRFQHEAQAVGRLVHPRIVQIYDYGEDEETEYIVMELVNGKTLARHLAQETVYEMHEVGEIIRQLLDGIGYAHGEGVIHRDIKPSNIMINNDGRIKISDFGIAHIESSDLTQSGDVFGTLHYMAPEQFLGADVNELADLYAIGVIAYELLTGSKPFYGTAATIMQQVLNETPANPSLLNPKLSPLMDRVLQQALAKNRRDRFQSAREFSEAFREALGASLNSSGAAAGPAAAALDSKALLNAAKLLNTAGAKPVAENVDILLEMAGESAISLDTGVKRACLLVIDDEERILTALKSLFRTRYHVFATTDGNKALDFLGKHQMHVIVSDQRMPVMQGVELLRRSREISPRSVRILLTGYSDLAAIVGSINDGEVYRFISKPWDNSELQRIIAEAATIALELADTKTEPVALPKKMDAGILVIDKDEEIFRVTRELIGGLCQVIHAANLESAFAALRSQEIAVVIADIDSGHEQLTAMLKLLKQEHPQILSVVVTTASDSELVIELINQAQIFRFLNKPVNVRLLKSHVHAALQRYLTYRQTPKLVAERRPQLGQEEGASSLDSGILDSIKSQHGR